MDMLSLFVPKGVKRWLRERALRGDAVWCPVCEQGAAAFLPSGDPPRPHAMCPFCGSLERTRLTWLYLKERGLPTPGMRVLHIAPDRSLHARLSTLKDITYLCGDKHEPGYSWPEGTIDLDVTRLPFPDDWFDVVICSHVLEHVPDDRTALRELFRVMKPGGHGVLLVPVDRDRAETFEDPSVTDPEARKRLFGQADHVRIYGMDYADRLREAGFRPTIAPATEGRDAREVFRLGLNAREFLQAVTKPA